MRSKRWRWRKRKYKQVTCLCERYDFPHRLAGGNCKGQSWAESYYETEHSQCRGCNCNVDARCQVADGAESVAYCEGAIEHFQNAPAEKRRHPEPIDAIYDNEIDENEDGRLT
jgi:hypothetical protein